MKLSDAILLGSTLIKWKGGEILRMDGSGCAIGMGLAAYGVDYEAYAREGATSVEPQHRIWHWITAPHNHLLEAPCGCIPSSIYSPPYSYEIVIAHLFDNHVSESDPNWTLEKLVDYVRSVEPAEEAPRCAEQSELCTDAVSKGVA